MMRLGKLSMEEEEALGNQLLNLHEIYFTIQNVELNRTQHFSRSKIVVCSKCGELIPQDLTVMNEDSIYCTACQGRSYYKIK